MLSDAIPREVDRVESDVGRSRAARVRIYLINFARFTGDVPLDRIGVDLLERHQRHRLAVAATDTVNHEICAVIAMLKRHGFQVAKPSPKAGRRTEQRAFTADELPRFFAVCPDRLRPLYLTMLATGARQAELVPSPRSNHKPLLKAEVNLDARQIVIRSAKRRQGQPAAPRVLPIPNALVSVLADQLATTNGSYVFRPLANSDRDFNAILRRAGISKTDELGRKVTAHSFRHTWATLQAAVVSDGVLQMALGHAQVTQTADYRKQVPVAVPDVPVVWGELISARPAQVVDVEAT